MSKYLHSTPKPDGVARAQCVSGVCRALVYLHSRSPNIVHSDVKPSNTLVEHCWDDSSGSLERVTATVNAKLLDFGLALVRTRTGRIIGGVCRWAAPETFSQKKTPLLPAADVYSFGRPRAGAFSCGILA